MHIVNRRSCPFAAPKVRMSLVITVIIQNEKIKITFSKK